MDEADLERTIELALKAEYPQDFSPPEIPWASSLPICPRRVAFQHLISIPRQRGYRSDFYSGIGTHLHTSVQTALARAGLLWGNFKCCGVMYENTWGNFLCPVCDRPPRYSEYAIRDKVSGRCDGILPILDAILEIKSKSMWAVRNMKEPDWKHWAMQASVYANVLRRRFPHLSLTRIVMLYVARENPREFVVFVRPAIDNVDVVVQQEHQKAMEWLERGEIAPRICETPAEGREIYCDYEGICFSPDIDVQWDRLIRER